ncbi:uncharacterized protein BX664DRAFT_295036 [Halteromyces radiatus]|uniref:uncharacterized protein n=1 Tax=Halteromyces radiatus TaxID=101107 RepID=UPI002220299F|nr:uncharacterized protein BX664DRAFT_295036 [Halteromyces radiatus]KAI8093345.1 hypothetical protein BX664DRAFT_295036 [Halteromyces radiatus]
MPPRKKSVGRRSEPKLFRCTGFGDCDMVFTRSEHLARHARKHTGEKPFKCVVPGCDRMFSRFDNMMQHTQTHNRSNKKKSSKAGDYEEYKRNRSHSIQHTSSPLTSSVQQPMYQTNYPPPPQWQPRSPSPGYNQSMIESRTLPPPRRMSFSQSFYPPPLSKSPSLPDSPEEPMSATFRSSPYYTMPPTTPGIFDYPTRRPSYRRGSLQSVSTTTSTSSTSSASSDAAAAAAVLTCRSSAAETPGRRRRLSAADLQAPIYSLQEEEQEVHPLTKSPPAVVDITSDEYEALQGFGKFSQQQVLPAIQPNQNNTDSPRLSAQVAAFRQKRMPVQESFQRPVKNNAM